jgi:integrase
MRFKLYAKGVRGQEDYVYLYLYYLMTGERQPHLTSLGIKIPEKCCFPDKKNFEKVVNLSKKDLYLLGYENLKELNNHLEHQLNTYIRNNGRVEFIPDEKKTLNEWFEKQIERQINQGTKMRYKNVYNLLVQFQMWYSVNKKKQERTKIIYMKNVNVDYILEFRKWLLSEPNPNEFRKKNAINSSNYKLKCLKSLLNKSHSEGYYFFPINPFDHIKFQFKEQQLEILSLDELKKLIETDLREVLRRTKPTIEGKSLFGEEIEGGVEERNKKNKRYKAKHSLNDIRNYFLFQLFSQGIRVSDLVTLRWNNFHFDNENVLRINKTMVKTKKSISILVNEKMISILSNYIIRYKDNFPDKIEELEYTIERIKSAYSIYTNKVSVLLFSDDWYSNLFYHIIDNNTKYYSGRKEKGIYVDEVMIERLREFLLNSHRENTLHHYINDNKPFGKRQNRYVQFSKVITRIEEWHKNNLKENETYFQTEYKKLREKRYKLVLNLINLIIKDKELKSEFVFTLLNNSDFNDISEEEFSILSEHQYRKFQSARCYYNKLLKLIAIQSGISKRLTSHLSRHSYTSLMLELGEDVNLFDLMTSLGHKHLSTTQTYIQRLSNKKIDKLNLVISEKLNTETTINI